MNNNLFLAPVIYSPSDDIKNIDHSAIFINDDPFVLLGNIDDKESSRRAQLLLQKTPFIRAIALLGWHGSLKIGNICGCDVNWCYPKSIITVINQKEKSRHVAAIFLHDQSQTLATLCCVHEGIADIFIPGTSTLYEYYDKSVLVQLNNPGIVLVQ